MFEAIMIEKVGESQVASRRTVDPALLPDGDVLVDVAWSTLNYKDALAISGKAPVVRSFPMVPGIDFVGTVAESSHPGFRPGDRVIHNGWGVGEKRWGGLAGQARVMGDWLVHLPAGITPKQAMAIGTAGYTAMLCAMALERHGIRPDDGEIAVTGAAGGVGSVATALLSAKGYRVAAVTGRPAEETYLRSLGATSIIDRKELSGDVKALARERWIGAIDVAGGTILANLLSMMAYRGVVACCGLAAGLNLPATVAPFILRGVTLAGIDSVMCPREDRVAAWTQLADQLDMALLDTMTTEVAFDEVIETAPKFLEGQVRGRIVVPINP